MAQSWLQRFKRARRFLGLIPEYQHEALRYNAHQIFYFSPIAVLGSLAHILIFWVAVPAETDAERLWRSSIIYAHTVLTLAMALLFLINVYATRPRQNIGWLYAVNYIGIFIVMAAGAGIAAVDQLVRTQIIPFLTASVALAVFFRMEPYVAVVTYAASYFLFVFALHITQTDPIILSSNVVNGITAVAIGLSLSLVLWHTFVRSLRQEAHIKRQQQEIHEKNQELERLASIDPLTGLLNRRSFEERFAVEVSRMARDGGKACLAVMDIDDFKRVNDAFGHPVGDALLRRIAQVLAHEQRPSDLISRLGGEEFVILFADTTEIQGTALAERLRLEIESRRFDLEGQETRVTVSFGVTEVDVHAAKPFMESYRRADRALYLAKEAGKNQVAPACDVPHADP